MAEERAARGSPLHWLVRQQTGAELFVFSGGAHSCRRTNFPFRICTRFSRSGQVICALASGAVRANIGLSFPRGSELQKLTDNFSPRHPALSRAIAVTALTGAKASILGGVPIRAPCPRPSPSFNVGNSALYRTSPRRVRHCALPHQRPGPNLRPRLS